MFRAAISTPWRDRVVATGCAGNGGCWACGTRSPYAFVQVQGEVELSQDPAELLRIATAIAARYVGPERAEEFGKRNGVPGELIVRLRPAKVLAAFNMVG